VAAGAALGWLLPAATQHALLGMGRRVGLGERLAALHAMADRADTGVAALLTSEIAGRRWKLWRLASGRWEAGALLVGVAMVGALWLPPSGEARAPEVATVVEEPMAEEVPQDEQDDDPVHAETPREPADRETAGYTPYSDLFIAALGLEALAELGDDPDALTKALAEQQGLLRELAERLSELATTGGALDVADEVSELASELARDDLRDIVLEAARSGDARDITHAAEALDSALETQRELAEDEGFAADLPDAEADGDAPLDGPDQPRDQGPPADGEFTGGDAAAARDEARRDGMHDLLEMNGVPAHRASGDDDAADDTPDPQYGGPPGAAHVEPDDHEDGVLPEVDPDEPPLPVDVRPGEGQARAYLVFDVPGEGPAEITEPREMSPQEVDLLLRGRAVPPELRDLIQRYFQHVNTQDGGE